MNQEELMDSILQFWKENDSFKRSINERSEKLNYNFYDGPPFASGDPHYGHLLVSATKDLVARYVTMNGYRVFRKWGWDCHGLPIEHVVEKKLGIKNKKQLDEEVGIQKFTDECKSYVHNVNDAWKWFIDHVGRWVDIDNAYFTMDKDYMESVINVFSNLYRNNLIFKGFKIQGYCPRCATTLSNHEMNEGYADKQDNALTVKFPFLSSLKGESEYSVSEDGFIDVTAGVLKKDDKYLMIYQQKENLWLFPGGKVNRDETLEKCLSREIKEEVDLDVISSNKIGTIKVVLNGKARRVHYYEIETSGEPKLMETYKHTSLKWIEKIDLDNELGYGIKIDDIIIDDESRLKQEFLDIYLFEKNIIGLEGIDTGAFNFLVWTTTARTLPSNMLLAVGQDVVYEVVFDKITKEYYILAQKLVSRYYKDENDYVSIYTLNGSELKGLNYEPLFDFYEKSERMGDEYLKDIFQVKTADFVSDGDGTGIVHIAPYGEDDYRLLSSFLPKEKVYEWLFITLDEYANFYDDIGKYGGQYVFDANKTIYQDLKADNKIVKVETINHSYPHCWRCDTPLIYKAVDSWFVNEPSKTSELVEEGENINFVPNAIKKRFLNIIGTAPDWNISRNRYWGAPIPVWEAEDGEIYVPSSIEEIEKLSGQEVKDLHRPYIDEIIIKSPTTGKEMRRVPFVLDCWFESGAMPFAQDHYPFAGKENLNYPADFIVESLDQTRGWFRSLHVLGTLNYGQTSYKNVLVTGMIMAEDGKKMSKKLKNYPDPKILLNKYGGDSFRLYVLSSPLIKSEQLRFSEKGVEQMMKDFVIPMENVYKFFETYAQIDNYKNDGTEVFWMRHAESENNDSKNQPLDDKLTIEGEEAMSDKEFIKKVLRTNPDIIYTTNSIRTQKTAIKVQSILKDYLNKDIEIIEEEKLRKDFIKENTGVYSDLLEKQKGKRILVIGHAGGFRLLFEKLYGSLPVTNGKTLSNLEIIKLPTYNVTNELDKWILAELNQVIESVSDALDKYYLDIATKAIIGFMDKLTNWYLRRSRRRFWAEGMDEDKTSAYNTLFEVIKTYLQLSAPFVPFVTENIRIQFNQFMNKNLDSLHLEYRPIANQKYIDDKLIKETSIVRKIVKGGMYIRSKNKIKVKQPLQNMEVKLSGDPEYLLSLLETYKNIIAEEVNIKDIISFPKDLSIDKKYKAIGKQISSKFGKDTGNIIKFSKIGNVEELEDSKIKIFGDNNEWELEKSDYEISYEGLDGDNVFIEEGVVVRLNLEITEELKKERISREISRFLNQMRKDANYYVNDRINMIYSTDSNYLKSIIEEYKDFFQKEVLIKEINELGSVDNFTSNITQETDFDGKKIIFSLNK